MRCRCSETSDVVSVDKDSSRRSEQEMAFRCLFSCRPWFSHKLLIRSVRINIGPTTYRHGQSLARRHLVTVPTTNKWVTGVEWDRAISDAERIVGYSTSSFHNLRWVLSDEIASVAPHLRKIVGSKHPLLATAK